MTIDWKRDLRFILTAADDIADPIERLEFLTAARAEITEVLTTVIERACWDARAADREQDALRAGQMSRTAFRDYAIRWNGRLQPARRIRWFDPLRPHRRSQVEDLTKVAEGATFDSIRSGFREPRHDPPKQ